MASQKNIYASACCGDHQHLETPFDLQAEYAYLAVRLGRFAQERKRALATAISPDTPRHFLGHPDKLRELIFAMAENFLTHEGVDGVQITIDSEQLEITERHQLSITVTAHGRDIKKQFAELLEPPTRRPQVRPYLRHQHAMFRINKLLMVMKGGLLTEKTGQGIQHVARLQLTCSPPNPHARIC